MYNIRQLTNYDTKNFPIEYKMGGGNRLAPYTIIRNNSLGGNMVKFGYCAADPRAIGYPIYITVNGYEQQIYIGKTGMFEVNIEDYYDEQTSSYRTVTAQVTEIKVPAEIPYSLDYVLEI